MPSTRGSNETPSRQTRSQGGPPKQSPVLGTHTVTGRKTGTKNSGDEISGKKETRTLGRPTRQSTVVKEKTEKPANQKEPVVTPVRSTRRRTSSRGESLDGSSSIPTQEKQETSGKPDMSTEMSGSASRGRSGSHTTKDAEETAPTETDSVSQQKGKKRAADIESPTMQEGEIKRQKGQDRDTQEAPKEELALDRVKKEDIVNEQSIFSPRRSSRAVVPNSRFKDMELLTVSIKKSDSPKIEKKKLAEKGNVKLGVSIEFSKEKKPVDLDTAPVIKEAPNSNFMMTVITDDSPEETSTNTSVSEKPAHKPVSSETPAVITVSPTIVPKVLTVASPVRLPRVPATVKPKSPVKIVTSPTQCPPRLTSASATNLSPDKLGSIADMLSKKGIPSKPGQRVIVLGPAGHKFEPGQIRFQTQGKGVWGFSDKPSSLQSSGPKINIIPSKTVLNVSNVGKGGQIRIIPRQAVTTVKLPSKTDSDQEKDAAPLTLSQVNDEQVPLKKQEEHMVMDLDKPASQEEPVEISMDVDTDLSQEQQILQMEVATSVSCSESEISSSVPAPSTSFDTDTVTTFREQSSKTIEAQETNSSMDQIPVENDGSFVDTQISSKSSESSDAFMPFQMESEEISMSEKTDSISTASDMTSPTKLSLENRFCEVIQYEGQKSEEGNSVDYVMFGNKLVPIHRPQGHGRVMHPKPALVETAKVKIATPLKPGRVELGSVDSKHVKLPALKSPDIQTVSTTDQTQNLQSTSQTPQSTGPTQVSNAPQSAGLTQVSNAPQSTGPTQISQIPRSADPTLADNEVKQNAEIAVEKGQKMEPSSTDEGVKIFRIGTAKHHNPSTSEAHTGTTVTEVVDSKLVMEVSKLIGLVQGDKKEDEPSACSMAEGQGEGQEQALSRSSEESSIGSDEKKVEKRKGGEAKDNEKVVMLSDVGEEEIFLDETTGEMFNRDGLKIKIPAKLPSPENKTNEKEQTADVEMVDVTDVGTAELTVSSEANTPSDGTSSTLENTIVKTAESSSSSAQGTNLKYQSVGTKTLIKVFPNKQRHVKTIMSSTSTQTPIQEKEADVPNSSEDEEGEEDDDKPQTQEFIIVHLPEGTDVKQRYVKQCVRETEIVEEDVTMNSLGEYVCIDCDYTTSKKCNWFKHRRKHLGIKPHQCSQCDYRAATSSNLKRHMAIHQDIRKFVCDFCQLTFRQKIHLERHVKYKHEEKKVKCPLCDYTCASENPDLKTHIKRRHMPQEDGTMSAFTCTECGLMTVSKRDLKQHMKFHRKGPELKLFCEFCSFVTDCESRLRRHMFIHTKEKPFQCGLCEYRATQKEHVLRHMRTQHQVEVERTPRKSSSNTDNQSDTTSNDSDGEQKQRMFDRADYSSNDKIFACNHCTMKFAKLINLYKHLYAQHRSVMPDPSAHEFQCVVCDFRTNNKKNLLVHMRKHNMQDQTPPSHVYSCVLCRYINPRRRNLFQHMKKKHGIEIMMKEDGSTNCYLADNTPVVIGREEGDTNVMSLADIVTTTPLDEDSQLQIVTEDISGSNIPISNIISVEDVAYLNTSHTETSAMSSAPTQTQIIYPSLAEHEAAEAIEGLQALAQQAGIVETQSMETEMTDGHLMMGNAETEVSHTVCTSEMMGGEHVIIQHEESQLQGERILQAGEVIDGQGHSEMSTITSSDGSGSKVLELTEMVSTQEVLTSDLGEGEEVLEEIVSADDTNAQVLKTEEDSSIQLSSDQINQLSSGDYVEIDGEVYKVEISSEDTK